MGKKLTKFLNVITFGHLSRKAKKEAAKIAENKNDSLTLNTIQLPDINALVSALGGIENVKETSATISTISIDFNDINKVNFELLKKICSKGVVKSENRATLIIGDCATELKNKLDEMKK